MKKILLMLWIIATFSSSEVFALGASIGQTKYWWRNDDGNEATATWKAAANTQITVSDFNRLRLRIELKNTGGSAGNPEQTLEYSKDNGLNWVLMDNPATNAFTYQPSTQVANGVNTTQQMPAGTTGGFMAGKVVSAPGVTVPLNAGNKTEYEWVIAPTSNVEPSQTYTFRSSEQQTTATVFPTAVTTCFLPPIAGVIVPRANVLPCHSIDTLVLQGCTKGGQIVYEWQQDSGTGWSTFGGNTTTIVTGYLLSSTDFRCIVKCGSKSDTTAPVTVQVLPLPVDLGRDTLFCVDGADSLLLDAGSFPNSPSYLWQDGNTSPSRYAAQSGTYSVAVTDIFTCKGHDTILVTIKPYPVLHLGNDTNICNGASITLDAGPGNTSYLWNTGANAQQITLQSPGTFSVKVTNAEGCMKSDTITVTMSGEFPRIDEIFIRNSSERTFTFEVDNPRNIIAYDWDFGDNSPRSNDPSPTHTYAVNGTYTIKLRLQSDCGYNTYTRSTSAVGISEKDKDQAAFTIFPNPAQHSATVTAVGALKINKIELYSTTGQLIRRETVKGKRQHELDLRSLMPGTYYLKIASEKGSAHLKFQRL